MIFSDGHIVEFRPGKTLVYDLRGNKKEPTEGPETPWDKVVDLAGRAEFQRVVEAACQLKSDVL